MTSKTKAKSAPVVSAQAQISYWGRAFILLICLLPLPFGSNRPLFSDLMAVVCGVILCLALWERHSRHGGHELSPLPIKRLYAGMIGVTLVVMWSFIQVVPWTPATWHHPLWLEASHVLGPVSGSISIDTGVFPESLIRFISYIACFLIALLFGQEARNAKRCLHAIGFAGVVYAVYGLLAESSGTNSILWFKKWAYTGFLTSTFVNKNSYAVYAGIGLLCCLAYVWEHFRDLRPTDSLLAKQSKFTAVVATLSMKDFAVAAMPVIILAAMTLSGSRAGIFCSLLGAVSFLIALAINQKWKARRWIFLALVAFGLFITFAALGGDALTERLGDSKLDSDASMRLAAYDLEKNAIHDNPWLGFGLGTFESAFRLYRDNTLSAWFHHAHNDYLEMLMDLGIPVATVLFMSITLMISCCVQGVWSRRRNGIYAVVAVGASVILCLHALVDFSFHIPAIAAVYAALLGLGVAQSLSSRTGEGVVTATGRKPKKE